MFLRAYVSRLSPMSPLTFCPFYSNLYDQSEICVTSHEPCRGNCVSCSCCFLVRRDVKQLAVGAFSVGCRFSGIDCTHDL